MIGLCINCGWLGTEKETKEIPVKSQNFQSIIDANNMKIKVCPKCNQIEICWKNEINQELKNIGNVAIEKFLNTPLVNIKEKEEQEDSLECVDKELDEILNVAESRSKIIPDLDGKIRIKTFNKTLKCDICKKDFESKFDTSRCNECYDELMKALENDVKSANSKTKKKKKKNKKKV